MTKIVESVRIAEDPDKLWREIGKFGAVGTWHPMLSKVDSEGAARAPCAWPRAATEAGTLNVCLRFRRSIISTAIAWN